MSSGSKLLLIILALLLLTCSTSEKTYTIEEINGVRYVHNIAPLWADNQKIRLEHIQTIGGLDTEDENYQFHHLWGALKDSKGNIYVYDAGNYRVQKFRPNGEFLLTFGSKGQGPGEFEYTFNTLFDILENDNIVIGESLKRKQTFSPNGKLIETKLFERMGTSGRQLQNGLFYTQTTMDFYFTDSKSTSNKDPYLISVLDSEGNQVNSFGEVFSHDDEKLIYQSNLIQLEKDNYNNIYVNFLHHNRIEKYSCDGDLLLRISRELPYSDQYTFSDRKSLIAGESRIFQWAEFNKFGHELSIDHKGRIWVCTQIRKLKETENVIEERIEDLFVYEVYSPDGILLTRIDLKESDGLFRIFGDSMLVTSSLEACVKEYRIIDLEN